MKRQKLPVWLAKLSAAQRKHIKETTPRGTLYEFKQNRREQIALKIDCIDCRQAAARLGIE